MNRSKQFLAVVVLVLTIGISAYAGDIDMPGFVPPQLATLRAKPPGGDEWIHEVVFEKRVEGEGGPQMLGGARACPQEDCGGTFQYMQALHGDIEWWRPGYDPEAFDPAAVSFESKKARRSR